MFVLIFKGLSHEHVVNREVEDEELEHGIGEVDGGSRAGALEGEIGFFLLDELDEESEQIGQDYEAAYDRNDYHDDCGVFGGADSEEGDHAD